MTPQCANQKAGLPQSLVQILLEPLALGLTTASSSGYADRKRCGRHVQPSPEVVHAPGHLPLGRQGLAHQQGDHLESLGTQLISPSAIAQKSLIGG